MAFRRQSAMGTRKTRTQEASIAALLARLRTKYRAAQCVLVAETPFFSSLPMLLNAKHGEPRVDYPHKESPAPAGRRLPALFLGHGGPMNALADNDFTRALARLAAEVPHPRPSWWFLHTG